MTPEEYTPEVRVRRAALAVVVADKLTTSQVPENLRRGLLLYLRDGVLPGGFLQAVLANDLREAVMRGDPVTVRFLAPVVQFLSWEFPAEAWGSREAMLAWTTTPGRMEV